MIRVVHYEGPDGTIVSYEETPEEREQRIAERNAEVRKLLRMSKGQAEVIEKAQRTEPRRRRVRRRR